MTYPFITDLPPNAPALASTELTSLAHVWHDRRAELHEANALDALRTRLNREWAIETGLIERLYTWDRGVTEVLISQGIHAAIITHRTGIGRAHADHITDLIADQQRVIEGIYDLITEDRPLTEHDIRAMHQVMTAHQQSTEALDAQGHRYEVELLRGQYKQRPNSPRRPDGTTHPYCPPEHTPDEMARLMAWYHHAETTHPATPPEVLAASLHHRFTQIHPFQDGNGRIARALASFVFLKRRLFPLVIRDQDREPYITALEAADAGDLAPLVALFATRQRQALLAALTERPTQARGPEQILTSVIRTRQRRDAQERRYAPVLTTAAHLSDIAAERMTELSQWANTQLQTLTLSSKSEVRRADRKDSRSNTEPHVLHETARIYDYTTAPDAWLDWIELHIQTNHHFVIRLQFHPHSHDWQGVLASSAVTYRLHQPPLITGEWISPIAPVTPEAFQFNYAEPPADTKRRFRDWLESTITLALATWQQDPGL